MLCLVDSHQQKWSDRFHLNVGPLFYTLEGYDGYDEQRLYTCLIVGPGGANRGRWSTQKGRVGSGPWVFQGGSPAYVD
jgi:hypothetical protein